jgi:Flp pilus assembly protein TadD
MSKLPRFGSALSALALVGVLAGCASPMGRPGAHATKLDNSNIGLAMRAQLALAGGDFQNAVDLAERAVEASPNAPEMRALLGNVYFGAGRFASAEAAYRDTLSLAPSEAQIVLKLALVQIAQGKNAEALASLNAGRVALAPADYGLALALAGQPHEAVMVLEPAARAAAADARVRQNLALAYGLSGDWLAARTIAAQDLSADQLDSRVQQWMALAKPVRPSDQVAALVGVRPAAVDPGQPVRLALNASGTKLADQAPAQAVAEANAFVPPPAEEPAQVVAEYQAPPMAAAFEAPAAEDVVAAPVAIPAIAEPAPPPPLVAALAPTSEAPKPMKASKAAKARDGNAGVVVQLGAYRSEGRIEAAWEQIAAKYGSLRGYTPTSARFDGPKGTVYRLSVKGFDSFSEASGLCSSLRQQGKTCFVRRIAGDAPAQFASR